VWLAFRYELEGDEVTAAYAFSMFNSAPPVNAPPDDRVIPYEGLPPCGPDGSPPPGQIICGSTGFVECGPDGGPPRGETVCVPTGIPQGNDG
jgi:hypothetical protein